MLSPSTVKLTLKQLIDQQLLNFETLMRHCNSAQRAITSSDIACAALNNRLRLISQIWDLCLQTEGHIQHVKDDTNEEDMREPYFTEERFIGAEEYFLNFNDIIMKEVTRLEGLEADSVRDHAASSRSASTPRHQPTPLPTINIPKFSGKLTDWATFRDYFNSLIIQNKSIDSLQRFHFLKSFVEGEALLLLKNISSTENSFVSAWDRLKSRYENPRAIIQAELKALFSIQQMKNESVSSLKVIRNVVTEKIAALENLNRFSSLTVKPDDTEQFDGVSDILVFYVSQKLDPNTRMAWELFLGNSIEYPHFSTLLNFLDSRIRALEAIQSREENKPKCEVVRSHVVSNTNNVCPFCNLAHKLFKCIEFKKISTVQRFKFVKSKNLCLNCFGKGHSINNCTSTFTCAHCQAKHHTLLHFKRNVKSDEAKLPENKSTNSELTFDHKENAAVTQSLHATPGVVKSHRILLATAQVIVISARGRAIKVRALLDQGSTWTFISEELANALQIRPIRSNVQLRGLVMLMRESRRICTVRDGLKRGNIDEPIAQNTIFGWILSGNIGNSELNQSSHSEDSAISCLCISNETLSNSVQRFWEVEEVPHVSDLTELEKECESHFKSTHSRWDDGRYVVRYPFKSGPPINIGNSLKFAEKSLTHLSKPFEKSPQIADQYKTFMTDYENQGHMTRIPRESTDQPQVVYIPHHPIIRESSSTTKLRVVFNASSKTSNSTSLNEHMHIGPKLQGNIFQIILLWRTFRFVYASDIAQMYRQILIDEKDRNYQRILWFDSSLDQILTFRLNTVTYGTAAAPYLALRVLQQLIEDEGELFPLASFVLKNQIYIDDCLFGGDSKKDIIKIRNEVVSLFGKGRLRLRKWASNSLSLLEDIDSSEHGHAPEKPLSEDDSLKILGIVWVPAQDVYQFKIQLPSEPTLTKRGILSLIARLYDPLGLVSPVIVTAKILMQKLWLKSINWDEDLPQDFQEFWSSYYKELACLNELSIPRWTGQGLTVVESSIHGFSDASNAAYAAVVYIRLLFKSGEIRTTLLSSRTKVAPIKVLSVPRLELCGALLLTQLVSAIKAISAFSNLTSTFWTDSTIVLAWLKKHSSSWKTFVANRVAAIQAVAPFEKWRHIDSEEKPADLGSRGVRASDFRDNQLWWRGPPRLSSQENSWPSFREVSDTDTDLEARSHVCQVVENAPTWFDNLIAKISKWEKLLRIVAYVLKFLWIKSKLSIQNRDVDKSPSFVEFCQDSQLVIVRFIQLRLFPNEIMMLKENKSISKSNALIKLNPFLDDKTILRVGGRLSNAPLDYNRRHPAILKKHHLIAMIVRHYHEKCLHGATQLTLNLIRQFFWILRSRQVIKSVIYNCVTCVRLKATVAEQLMGSLPINRVSRPSRPFLHVGVDYAGPIKLKSQKGRGHSSHLAYIAVFVCFAVRAIHLEIVHDYTSDAFIAALSRFVARRGLPLVIHSDHGTNFKGACRELDEHFKSVIKSPEVQSYLINDKIRWEFIPPAAAHFGGIWESGVRSVKHHLRRILKDRTPHFEELNTLLCQIEMCLNSRPISPLTDDPTDLNVLTPGHFLIRGELTAIPEISLLDVKENRLSRWQLWQQLLESFWKAWSQDYLLSMQQRNKWQLNNKNLEINQLVLIKNESLPPTKWPLGRVIQVKKGSDNLVRVATIRTASGTYVRPITKLILLPVKHEND